MSNLMMNKYIKILKKRLICIVVQKSGFWGMSSTIKRSDSYFTLENSDRIGFNAFSRDKKSGKISLLNVFGMYRFTVLGAITASVFF